MANVSSDFLWIVSKNTDCALVRKPNGVGDLSTCHYNPTGIHNPRSSAFANQKHLSVVADQSGEGFYVNHQSKKHSNKPASAFKRIHVNNLKSSEMVGFKNLLRHRLSRKDILPAVIRKANRIAFLQNKLRRQSKQEVKKN